MVANKLYRPTTMVGKAARSVVEVLGIHGDTLIGTSNKKVESNYDALIGSPGRKLKKEEKREESLEVRGSIEN